MYKQREIVKQDVVKRAAVQRTPLDCDLIARTALVLIDEQGIEQLSMRRLGAALGVEAMALYHHYRNKAELLDGIHDNLLAELELSLTPDGTPFERIRRILQGFRQVALDHPHIFMALVQRRFGSTSALVYYERLLQLFQDAGLSTEQSARYYRVMANYTIGAGMTEVCSRTVQADAAPLIRDSVERLQDYPRVQEVMPFLQLTAQDSAFEFGLDLIFTAMQNELSPPH